MSEPRKINLLFMTALLSVPILFVWFLFLPGYARSTRMAALLYAFATPVLVLLTALGEYLAGLYS